MIGRRGSTRLAGLLACVLMSATWSFEELQPSLPVHYAPTAEGAEGGLWMQVEQAEQMVAGSPRRLQDPALDAYLHDILCRLAADYCADIRVYVMRVPAFNASMMPNGAMQVWTGLLLRAHDEAQLATVLAHELGHYLRRHSLKGYEDQRNKANLLTFLTLGLGAAVVGGGMGAGAAQGTSLSMQMAAATSLFAFSREQEGEADKFGIQLLAKAGYDPRQAASVWRNLIAEEHAESPEGRPRDFFFATHPSPERREEQLRDYARELAGRQTLDAAEARARYLAAVGAHLPDFFADELRLNHLERSQHLLERLADAGFAPGLVNFYLGEIARRKDTGSLSDAALAHYQAALPHADAPAETHRALGLWYLKARRRDEARAAFLRYLERAPAASDREMIQFYLSQLGGEP